MVRRCRLHGLAVFWVLLGAVHWAHAASSHDIAFLVLDQNSYVVDLALQGLEPEVKVSAISVGQTRERPEAARQTVARAKVVVADVMGKELLNFLAGCDGLKGKPVYALRGSLDDASLKKMGYLFDDEVAQYYRQTYVENIRNMLRLVAHRHIDSTIAYGPVKKQPEMGVYHPDAKASFPTAEPYLAWQAGRPGFDAKKTPIGLLFYPSYLTPGQKPIMDQIIRRFEETGFNVMPCFGREEQVIPTYFLDKNKQARIKMLVSFSLKFNSSLTDNLARQVAALDVPVFNAVNLYAKTLDQWEQSMEGVESLQVTWTMAVPEISGAAEPTVLSGKKKVKDEGTGKTYYIGSLASANLDRLIDRIKGWDRLQKAANPDKKVAIMFYNHHQGKQNIGASYLNVFKSIAAIQNALDKQGYQAGKSLSKDEVKALLLTSARNIGSWAPGELDKLTASGEVVRVPLDEYRSWFATLPKDFRENVIRQWGTVDDSKIMIQDNAFIIPAARTENLILLPEPSRGWGDDPMKLYHDTTLYPHHQYLAVYLWLQKNFKAHAVIHLGTHATYEWTPGKQAGLSPSCSPEVLTTNIPNLYPYIVDDVGEGIQAKRRGRGVIISHLTPVLKSADIDEEYARMADLAGEIEQGETIGSQAIEEKKVELFALAEKTGIFKDLPHLPENEDEKIHVLGHYLEAVKESLIPYGMHTFGVSPVPEAAKEMTAAIKTWDPEASQNKNANGFESALKACGPSEMAALIHGLNGGYVAPGPGNDPVRNPDAIPTGKNFYGFNPGKMPSPAAWALGVKAGDQIIANHLKNKGGYPHKVAVVLWATESLRNEGMNECTILYLIGVKPKWNKAGRVLGLELMTKAELNRPRIDVMINASGLYRDLFPDKMLFLDEAVRLAARQTDVENLIARHNQETKTRLIKEGMDPDEAEEVSRFRVFSEPPGAYGNGVSEMASGSSLWDDPDRVAEVWENRTGYAFGKTGTGKSWGIPAQKALKAQLAQVDAVTHSKSSNVYGLMDNDDMFQYLGGLAMAVRKEAGKSPETLVTKQTKGTTVAVEDLAQSIGMEMRARYLNPKWIKGMKAEGYAGARAMADFVEYLWGWNLTTPDKVDESKWNETYDVYVADKYGLEMDEFFAKASPWAFQSITARMLETHRKGYWKADQKKLETLAADYAKSIVAKGIACCEHTCNNPMLNQMVVSIVSIPGVLSPEIADAFKMAVEEMAGKTLTDQVKARQELLESLTAPGSRADMGRPSKPGDTGAGEQETVEGFKMEEIKKMKDKTTKMSTSGMEWMGLLAVLAVLALVSLGFYKRQKLHEL